MTGTPALLKPARDVGGVPLGLGRTGQELVEHRHLGGTEAAAGGPHDLLAVAEPSRSTS